LSGSRRGRGKAKEENERKGNLEGKVKLREAEGEG